MKNRIRNKVVLVTGGTRGIGLAISQLFAREGAKVAAIYRSNDQRAKKALLSLKGHGHRIIKSDLSDAKNIASVFDEVENLFGRLDILVNNAGIGFHHPIDTSKFEEWQEGWQKILDTNLLAPANMCFYATNIMLRQKRGRIINITSRGAFRGEPEQPAYGASKAGLNSLTQSLAYRLAEHNIFVGAIAPGFVETDMAHDRLQGKGGKAIRSQSPMNRVAHPKEVAEAVLLMAKANMWMTGGIFDVNGASYFRT